MTQQKQELLHSKKGQQTELKSAYDRASDAARDQARSELAQRRQDEQTRLAAVKEAIARDNAVKKQMIQQRNSEMNSTLKNIDQHKRDEWHRKVNDKSNKEQSMAMQSEKERLKAELKNTVVKSKQEYYHDLTSQNDAVRQSQAEDRKQRRSRLDREGFEFE